MSHYTGHSRCHPNTSHITQAIVDVIQTHHRLHRSYSMSWLLYRSITEWARSMTNTIFPTMPVTSYLNWHTQIHLTFHKYSTNRFKTEIRKDRGDRSKHNCRMLITNRGALKVQKEWLVYFHTGYMSFSSKVETVSYVMFLPASDVVIYPNSLLTKRMQTLFCYSMFSMRQTVNQLL